VLNLLINAAHAVSTGGPQDNEIEVGVSSDERGRVVIHVRDTGAGMTDDVKRGLFEPFSSSKAGGLGLSVCLSIVRALGGRLEVESRVGAGTTFFVILPPAPPAGPPVIPGPASFR